jgi:unsaturated rhamnogalacturonyl hydrolase
MGKSKSVMRQILIFTVVIVFTNISFAYAQADLKHWTSKTSPEEIGKRIANRFIATPHTNFGKTTPPKNITYSEVCVWYGALTFAEESGNKELFGKLKDRFDTLIEKESNLIPVPDHVDRTVFGAIPFELYKTTNHDSYLVIGKSFADKQWDLPEDSLLKPQSQKYLKKGLSWQTRMWIDDMYMITAVQAQASRATNDTKYIDRAANEMVVYLDSLQRDNGLFYHAPDVPFFWGRGNGWMAAGSAELLRTLPKNHPQWAKIMESYKKMMATLLKYQDESGMWRQLIDDSKSWPETSCTGMFTFAMITGVKNGWLDKKTYGAAARKRWLALVTYLDENGDIREVCQGTNKKNDRQYYLDRKRLTGDMHGQAPLLWCATALLRN